jgi:hypothetical protein
MAELRVAQTVSSEARLRGTRTDHPIQTNQDQAVYLVLGQSVERWPRSDPMTGCS